MSNYAEVMKQYGQDTGPFRVNKQGATELAEACAAVAELVDACKSIEAHNVGATMGEWERFGDALAKVTGENS